MFDSQPYITDDYAPHISKSYHQKTHICVTQVVDVEVIIHHGLWLMFLDMCESPLCFILGALQQRWGNLWILCHIWAGSSTCELCLWSPWSFSFCMTHFMTHSKLVKHMPYWLVVWNILFVFPYIYIPHIYIYIYIYKYYIYTVI